MIILQVISFLSADNCGRSVSWNNNRIVSVQPDTERFKRVPELGWTFVYYIKEDKQGNLWLATYADGVYKKNVRTGGWEHFVHEEADSSTLPSNKVLSIFEDSQNQLWFTTQGGGFCRFVPSANTFVRYDGIGLPSNVIYRIEEDEKGLFWVSTNKGWCILTRRIPVLKCIQLLMGC